ncbi:hypothetical protein [Halorubrum laminariae]|uniref:DUF8080 domain-containing protein n=1 Tax=Halorubrum laminariae TaxID=1433523 RepID=A0ABD6C0P0_9EURY|nr:hypothetical protein [Halorubrum laminariae]
MDLTWTVERDGGASLVRCRVRNDEAVPRRVRLDSRLDGPVLPPRRRGVPEAGWDATGVVVRLAPGKSRAVGFAALADPVEPPVEMRVTELETDADTTRIPGESDQSLTVPAGTPTLTAIHTLGDHRPPRETVTGEIFDRSSDPDVGTDQAGDGGGDASGDGRENDGDDAVPTAVDEWLDAVADRVERAERITDADLATATAVVEETGGLRGLSDLDRRVDADTERLRVVSERTAALAARADATDVPIESLERLA